MTNDRSNAANSKEIHQIVLLRGLARESRHWGSFLDDLKKSYADRGLELRLETIDLPGCGRHSEMISLPSIDKMADFARERFSEILRKEAEQGLPPAQHRRLVAVSLGGMVATSWLGRYPSDFQSAVMINSSLRGLSKFYERMQAKSWWRVPLIATRREMRDRESEILNWISNRPERRQEVLEEWTAIQHSRPVSLPNMAMQLLAAASYEPPKRIAVPLLLLVSRQDRLVDPECSNAIARAFGGDIQYHPTAGHDLTLDDGPWSALKIVEWKS